MKGRHAATLLPHVPKHCACAVCVNPMHPFYDPHYVETTR